MRFVHTADWHLGRLFHGIHLTDDQAHVLAGFVDLVKSERPDAVIIAGDIYDRAVPPPEAVELLDEILSKIVIDLNVPIILIAGNHDSPGRLHFGSRLMAGRRLFVTGTLPRSCDPVLLEDAAGAVAFYPLPFAEPAFVRQIGSCDDIVDHNTAMTWMTARIRQSMNPNGRNVLIAHAFVQGGRECESERPLSVGGAGCVDEQCFNGFHYVALGHLHCPQKLNGGSIRYSGSLLKYSFDESAQKKVVELVELSKDGSLRVESIALSPRRDVRRIEGVMADLLKGPSDGKSRDDYIEAMLLDDGPVLDAIGQLRKIYPNIMSIRRPELASAQHLGERANVKKMRPRELFTTFYEQVTGAKLTAQQDQAFVEVADRINAAEQGAP